MCIRDSHYIRDSVVAVNVKSGQDMPSSRAPAFVSALGRYGVEQGRGHQGRVCSSCPPAPSVQEYREGGREQDRRLRRAFCTGESTPVNTSGVENHMVI